jgi:hypothetical protein
MFFSEMDSIFSVTETDFSNTKKKVSEAPTTAIAGRKRIINGKYGWFDP